VVLRKHVDILVSEYSGFGDRDGEVMGLKIKWGKNQNPLGLGPRASNKPPKIPGPKSPPKSCFVLHIILLNNSKRLHG